VGFSNFIFASLLPHREDWFLFQMQLEKFFKNAQVDFAGEWPPWVDQILSESLLCSEELQGCSWFPEFLLVSGVAWYRPNQRTATLQSNRKCYWDHARSMILRR
jgi:hypothetical protein